MLDQSEMVLLFCIRVFGLLAIAAAAVKLARFVSRPTGTYGNGLPERRRRPRLVLRDPLAIPRQ
jgi:hypothetical protein